MHFISISTPRKTFFFTIFEKIICTCHRNILKLLKNHGESFIIVEQPCSTSLRNNSAKISQKNNDEFKWEDNPFYEKVFESTSTLSKESFKARNTIWPSLNLSVFRNSCSTPPIDCRMIYIAAFLSFHLFKPLFLAFCIYLFFSKVSLLKCFAIFFPS